jgi:DNA-binding NarL/FixJ family response regulator
MKPPETDQPAPPRQRVFLVDDHVLVREGLAKLIVQEREFEICGEAGDVELAYAGIVRTAPHVVIVDLSLGRHSGLDLIKRLQALPQPPPVLVLSMFDESLYATRALRAGARGYVMKREASGKIIAGLRQVLAGQIYLSPEITTRAAGRFLGARPAAGELQIDRLSDRELEVFRRIGLGEENRQIADALHLSLKTVQTHCAHIKEKLGLASGTLLMRAAVRWVESDPGPPSASGGV